MRDADPKTPNRSSDEAPDREKIWDLPTRLLHWALMGTVVAGYLIGERMTFANAETHFLLGYVTGGLVVARLIWGVVGPPPARLWRLIPRPGTLTRYARGLFRREPSHWPGHNPLGGLSAAALLLALAAQVITGLMAYSDVAFAGGPLADWVSRETQTTATAWHHFLSNLLLGLVALHVAAIAFYAVWKRENLVWPMITGWKRVRRR